MVTFQCLKMSYSGGYMFIRLELLCCTPETTTIFTLTLPNVKLKNVFKPMFILMKKGQHILNTYYYSTVLSA